MNSSDIAKVLTTNPNAIFMFKFGSRRGNSYCGRIVETHEQTVSIGYRPSGKTRRVTTYTVELITQKYNTQPVSYEIKTHYSKVHPKDIDWVVTDRDTGKPLTKTLEQLCEDKTLTEREYQKRTMIDVERKKALVTKLALTANIAEYEVRTLSLVALEAIAKVLGDNDSTVLVSVQEG